MKKVSNLGFQKFIVVLNLELLKLPKVSCLTFSTAAIPCNPKILSISDGETLTSTLFRFDLLILPHHKLQLLMTNETQTTLIKFSYRNTHRISTGTEREMAEQSLT